ncbi:MAG: hypothetical protein IPH20_24310 [Bacteroidales bacterium]|nr:hypothetical protein [Bacteroidales bacterium]
MTTELIREGSLSAKENNKAIRNGKVKISTLCCKTGLTIREQKKPG